jgi:hypothetical protein
MDLPDISFEQKLSSKFSWTLFLLQVEDALSEVEFQLKVDLHFTDSEQQWVLGKILELWWHVVFLHPFPTAGDFRVMILWSYKTQSPSEW